MPTRRTIYLPVIPVAFLAFAALGLTTGLLGLAWPSMRSQFGLALDSVNQIYIASMVACTAVSFMTGRLMGRFGSGATLLTGAALLAAAMFGIAQAHTWAQVVALSAISGLGSGLLDAGLNLYLARYHGPREMSWLHACFGIGSTLGPLVMTAVLDRGLEWQAGYGVAGAGMVIAVLLLAVTLRTWQGGAPSKAAEPSRRRASFGQSLGIPAVWIGIGGFVCCVGLEVAAGQWAFTLLVQSRGMRPDPAGLVVSAYWGIFTAGRILFGFLPRRLNAMRLLPWLAAGMVAGAALFWGNASAAGVVGLLVLGFAEAPVFPLLMAGTMGRVSAAHAENAVAFQMVASGLAAALVPGVIGTAGKHFGLETMSLCLAVLSVLTLGFCAASAAIMPRAGIGAAHASAPAGPIPQHI